MRIDLAGKTALITGSTAGIGLAIARAIADCDATVIINGPHRDAVECCVDDIGVGRRSNVRGVTADLSTAEGCAALFSKEPACDILINNVGIYHERDFFEIPDEEWSQIFQLNVMAGIRLSRAYMPDMLEKNWGRIVFLSSESALNVPVNMIHYGCSKTALLGLSRGLAKRAAGTGVTVNSVLPGPTLSKSVEAMLEPIARKKNESIEEAGTEFVRVNRPSSIIQRAATIEEVANMVVYVASPQASATTGAALRVDGGVIDSIV